MAEPREARHVRLGVEGNLAIGAAGLLAKRVAEKFKFRQDVYLAELDLGPVYCMFYGVKNNRRYEPLPRFPGVERDFSLFLEEGKSFAEVKQAIEALGIPEVTSIVAADLFRGKNVPAGKYSLLVRVTFQSREATLTEAQINDYSVRIVSALEKNFGCFLRASTANGAAARLRALQRQRNPERRRLADSPCAHSENYSVCFGSFHEGNAALRLFFQQVFAFTFFLAGCAVRRRWPARQAPPLSACPPSKSFR